MLADGFLEPMVEHMNELGWDVYSFDHEGGDGQYEFDFDYTDALSMADRMVVFRLMAKHVARSGRRASRPSCPSRTQTSFGSGAHLNMSLADRETGRNLFERGTAAPTTSGSRSRRGTTRSPTSSRPGCSSTPARSPRCWLPP